MLSPMPSAIMYNMVLYPNICMKGHRTTLVDLSGVWTVSNLSGEHDDVGSHGVCCPCLGWVDNEVRYFCSEVRNLHSFFYRSEISKLSWNNHLKCNIVKRCESYVRVRCLLPPRTGDSPNAYGMRMMPICKPLSFLCHCPHHQQSQSCSWASDTKRWYRSWRLGWWAKDSSRNKAHCWEQESPRTCGPAAGEGIHDRKTRLMPGLRGRPLPHCSNSGHVSFELWTGASD